MWYNQFKSHVRIWPLLQTKTCTSQVFNRNFVNIHVILYRIYIVRKQSSTCMSSLSLVSFMMSANKTSIRNREDWKTCKLTKWKQSDKDKKITKLAKTTERLKKEKRRKFIWTLAWVSNLKLLRFILWFIQFQKHWLFWKCLKILSFNICLET